MSTEDIAVTAEAVPATTVAPAQPARLDPPALQPAARLDEAVAAARLEERARIRAIVNSDAADGREKQALMLATETALTVAEAEKILGVSPKETRLEALAQRASAGPEFGAPGGTEKPDAGALIQESWKRAIANANRQFARA